MALRVWKPLKKPEFGLANSISDLLWAEEFRVGDLLTSVRTGSTLFLIGDYSGYHRAATHEAISFLLADLEYLGLWDEMRIKIRSRARLGRRRMSYKALNDKRRRQALVPFLRAANVIPGLLATFVIDKKLTSRLSEKLPIGDQAVAAKLSSWDPKSFQKLTRVGLLGAMLVAGMSAPGQNVIWISDEDELAPNDEKIGDATKVLGHYLSHFASHNLGHFRFGTTRSASATGTMLFEDASAIADLAAGACASVFPKWLEHYGRAPGRVELQAPESVLSKDRVIAAWLAGGQYTLRKVCFSVDAKDVGYVTKAIRLESESYLPEFDCRQAIQRHLAGRIIL